MTAMIQSRNLPKFRIDRDLATSTLNSGLINLVRLIDKSGQKISRFRAESRILLDWFRDNRAIVTGKQPEPDH